MFNNQNILERVKRYISEHDSVFVLDDYDSVRKLFELLISQKVEKKILLLVDELAWDSKFSLRPTEFRIVIRIISHEEYCNIHMLFHMYEFSDRIRMLNRNTQYGSLENYILSGLLREEEVSLALLK